MQAPLFIGVDGGGIEDAARVWSMPPAARLARGSPGAGNARLGDAGFAEIMKACRCRVRGRRPRRRPISAASTPVSASPARSRTRTASRSSTARIPSPRSPSIPTPTPPGSAPSAARTARSSSSAPARAASPWSRAAHQRRRLGRRHRRRRQSGMAIGRLAIRRSLWALEGMAPLTPLAEEILARFGATRRRAVDLGRARRCRATTPRFAPRRVRLCRKGRRTRRRRASSRRATTRRC